MSNPIKETSKLYDNLLKIYDKTKDKKERFSKCYNLVNKANYKDIHYVISMLKQSNSLIEMICVMALN